jgi:hypothetical protein
MVSLVRTYIMEDRASCHAPKGTQACKAKERGCNQSCKSTWWTAVRRGLRLGAIGIDLAFQR